MKRNQSIELLKLISAVLVVVIHLPFNSTAGIYMDAISRIAVPIFFMITGYFIIQVDNNSLKLNKQIIKLLKYYVIYELIYIAYYFIASIAQHNLNNFKSMFIENIKYFLVAPTIGFQLWYVINLIWVLLIIKFFHKINKLKLLFICSMALHLIGIVAFNLAIKVFHQLFPLYLTRSFLFLGLFYVLLGMYIRKIDLSKIRVKNNIILLFSILMCIGQPLERILWLKLFNSSFYGYFFSTIVASLGIFVYTLTLESTINNRIVEKITSFSMPIYFLQILSISILKNGSSIVFHFDVNVLTKTAIGNILFIIVVCILSCVLYEVTMRLYKLVMNRIHKQRIIEINNTNNITVGN